MTCGAARVRNGEYSHVTDHKGTIRHFEYCAACMLVYALDMVIQNQYGNCPLCEMNYRENERDEVQDELDALEMEHEEAESDRDMYESERDDLQSEVYDLDDQILRLNNELADLKAGV